jgi:hypothetical protein
LIRQPKKFKKKIFEGMGGGNNDWGGVLINEKPNQGVRKRKNVGLHCIRQPKVFLFIEDKTPGSGEFLVSVPPFLKLFST